MHSSQIVKIKLGNEKILARLFSMELARIEIIMNEKNISKPVNYVNSHTHTQTYTYIYTCRHTYTHIKFRMNCEDYINDYQW